MACSGACGIGERRAEDRRRAEASAAIAYPFLIWRVHPAAAAPTDEVELRNFATRADEVVAAGQGLELHRCGGATLRLEAQLGVGAEKVSPSRLEVVFSPLGRFVTLREVCTEDDGHGTTREVPREGVADRRWAAAVKPLQGLLRLRSFTLLDMAFLAERVPGPPQPLYEAAFGAPVTWWSLLFRPEPPTAVIYGLRSLGQRG